VQETMRIVSYNVQRESLAQGNKKFEIKVDEENSDIPMFKPMDDVSLTFVGRVLRHILFLTDPKRSTYVEATQTWYDVNGNIVFWQKTLDVLEQTVGIVILQGLDKLICPFIVNDVKKLVRQIMLSFGLANDKSASKNANIFAPIFEKLEKDSEDLSELATENIRDQYQKIVKAAGSSFNNLNDSIVTIGQMQLLRKLILQKVNMQTRAEFNNYYDVLGNLNSALLHEISNGNKPENEEAKLKHNELLIEISKLLEFSGFSNPLQKVYVLMREPKYFDFALMIIAVNAFTVLCFDRKLSTFSKRTKSDRLDGPSFVAGYVTLIKQFHGSNLLRLFTLISHYAKNVFNLGMEKGDRVITLPADVVFLFELVEEITKIFDVPRDSLAQIMPTYFFDNFKHM